MTNKYYASGEKDNLVYLHLEIDNSRCTPKEAKILKKYANVKYGDTISRDIIIPGDMPLGALHYVIQRVFGYINRYISSFKLPDDVFNNITQDDTYKWATLVGQYFSYPWFDYQLGYFNHKYCDNKMNYPEFRFKDEYIGPYYDTNLFSNAFRCTQTSIQEYIESLEVIKGLDDTFNIDKLSNFSSGNAKKDEYLKQNANNLKLSIKVSSILATHEDEIQTNQEIVKHNEYLNQEILQITHKLIYTYGAESKWIVNISRLENFDSFINDFIVDMNEVFKAENTVREEYKPCCVLKDGANVLDDVDNIPGFCEFLYDIFENRNIVKKKEALRFGRRRDWHAEEIDDPIIL